MRAHCVHDILKSPDKEAVAPDIILFWPEPLDGSGLVCKSKTCEHGAGSTDPPPEKGKDVSEP